MNFSLSLLESNSDIRQYILNALKDELTVVLNKAVVSLEPKLKALIKQALQNEPEYQSLLSGELRKQFGIADTSNVDTCINNLVHTIMIEVNPIKITINGLSGGVLVKIIPTSFDGIIDDTSAVVVDGSRGYSLPWLEWLLLRGGEIIVRNYEVQYGTNPESRSGDAIMVSSNRNWRVPAEFSGTARNNWVTRALSTLEEQIPQLIQNTLEASI